MLLSPFWEGASIKCTSAWAYEWLWAPESKIQWMLWTKVSFVMNKEKLLQHGYVWDICRTPGLSDLRCKIKIESGCCDITLRKKPTLAQEQDWIQANQRAAKKLRSTVKQGHTFSFCLATCVSKAHCKGPITKYKHRTPWKKISHLLPWGNTQVPASPAGHLAQTWSGGQECRRASSSPR